METKIELIVNYKNEEKILSVNLDEIHDLAIYSLGFDGKDEQEYLNDLNDYMESNKKHELYNLYKKVINSTFGKVLLNEMIKLAIIETTKITEENEKILEKQQKEIMDKLINLLEVNKIEVENRKKVFGKRKS